jgi:hypothetical protein
MIKDLTLDYNKQRQAAITAELLEITYRNARPRITRPQRQNFNRNKQSKTSTSRTKIS